MPSKITDEESSQTTLDDLQDMDLEGARFLPPGNSKHHNTPRSPKLPKLRLNLERLVNGLKAAFLFSATVCMWIIAFLSLRATQGSTPETTLSRVDDNKSLYTGFGDGDYGLAEDISGQVPTFEKQIWMFWNDSKFLIEDPRKSSHEDEVALRKAWESIVPEGNGFITIDDSTAPILPPPINRADDFEIDRFCLTVFHQLHCLRGIQEAFYDFVKDPSTEPALAHFNHCVDYLREGVMCYGDTALEGQSTYSSRDRANGNASNHVCKSFQGILEWANSRSSKRLFKMLSGHSPLGRM